MIKLKIGIFGKSGSGKTTVANFFEQKGFYHIDLDKIGRNIPAAYPQVITEVISAFGEEYVTEGQIDRKRLGALVFGNGTELDKLNAIFFRYIIKETLSIMSEHNNCVIEGAVLAESGLDKYMDKVIYVETEREKAVSRIVHREGISAVAASLRIDAQKKYDDMRTIADAVIMTGDSIDDLHSKLENTLEDFLK